MKSSRLINHLDPRSKMLFTLFIIIGVLLVDTPHFLYITIFLGLLIIIMLLSGYSIIFFTGKLLKIYPMILLITFLLPFKSGAGGTDIIFKLKYFTLYESGLIRFAAVNLKYIVIVLSTLILTTTTPYSRLIKGLESARLPAWFLAVLTFTFRLIYLLKDEMGKIYSAFQSRYISLPYYSKTKILAQMSGMYFVRVVGRSERTYSAMISRGFSGQCPSAVKLNWQIKDSLLTAAGFISAIIILMIQ